METPIYKLSYSNLEAAKANLISKGVLHQSQDMEDNTVLIYAPKTHAVVYLGNIELEKAEMDADGNITKETVLSPRYHVDVMTEAQIDFGAAEEIIEQKQPTYHSF